MGVSGEFIWLVESWCFGITGEQYQRLSKHSVSRIGSHTSQQGANDAASSEVELLPSARPYKGALAASEAEKRSNLPAGFWKLINKDSCIRLGILKFFGEDLRGYVKPVDYCCSKCAGSVPLLMNLRPPHRVQDVHTGKKLYTVVLAALKQWRASKAPSQFAGFAFNNNQILMHDSIAARISRTAGTITSLSAFEELIRKQWPFFGKYGPEVFEVIRLAVATVQSSQSGSERISSQRHPLRELDLNSSFAELGSSQHGQSQGSVAKRQRIK